MVDSHKVVKMKSAARLPAMAAQAIDSAFQEMDFQSHSVAAEAYPLSRGQIAPAVRPASALRTARRTTRPRHCPDRTGYRNPFL